MNNIRDNLFGAGPRGGRREDPYARPPQPPQRPPQDNQRGGYGSPLPPPPQGYNPSQAPARQPVPQRTSVGRSQGMPSMQLRIAKVEDKTIANQFIFGNLCAVSPQDFPPNRDGSELYLLINGKCVVSARPTQSFPPGCISLSDPQRTWCDVGMMEPVNVEMFDIFDGGRNRHVYLGGLDLEVGFASVKKVTETPFDQDILSDAFIKMYENQIFAPGQRLLMDYKNIPLYFTVKTVTLSDMSMEKNSGSGKTETAPNFRGILLNNTTINFFKDGKSPLKLKGSTKRPAANSIIAPNFKFEDMGIGGLDTEFGAIFRRAFASRIFPPGLVEKMGIQHVKGILLYGPPGTGKTLIARQIGNMLNARPPKIINGPEVLNKFVGQSEENIRKLFADAEKEYKEKGDESELHIIIFDELDAVCKQRGSGAGGGTGVGDSVVNQLLSKLDGVEQLNNILLIGMTNRKDMIDDALLRPGRLEVHMEISLPDEAGRVQILKIHTKKLLTNGVLEDDVDVVELAHLTRNFSGAEIGGLVKSASSFAFNRHVKVGTVAGISDDIESMKVNRADFVNALDEVKPAFGVSEEELELALSGGILHFSPHIQRILKDGRIYVEMVTQPNIPVHSVLLHGPPGSGKTALAAKIAQDSGFPFIKLISPDNMTEMSESAKVSYLNKAFSDAYKSPLNVVILDNIERLIEWVPIGPRFSNAILQFIMVKLTRPPPGTRRLLILATSSERSVMSQLDLLKIFDSEIAVPNITTYNELASVIREVNAFTDEGDIKQSLNELRDITGSDEIGVGIKKVLRGIEHAKLQEGNLAERFAETIAREIAVSRY